MADIKNVENIDVEIKPEKKKRVKQSKYTEEEQKQKIKEYQKRFFNKPEVKAKQNEYYRIRYNNFTDEQKQEYINTKMKRYYNMSEEERKERLVQCRVYKRNYARKKTEEKRLAKEMENNLILP